MQAPKTLPQEILAFRENHGLTRLALAIEVGVKENTVYRWERGRSQPSSLARKKLEALGVPIQGLVPKVKPQTKKKDWFSRVGPPRSELEVVPMSWVTNGPKDQFAFYKQLMKLQELGLKSLDPDSWLERLSLVERIRGLGETAQVKLEKPKATSKSWNSNYGAHGWHRYVGRFPPHLVRSILNYFGATEKDLVLDPFLGSGTTAVECRLLGIPFLGIEICPLSAMISRVKAKFPASDESVLALQERFNASYNGKWSSFLGAMETGELSHEDILVRPGNLIPRFTNIEKWFTVPALLGVSIAVEIAMEERGYERELLLTAISSKMRSIGNVDVDVVRAEYRKAARENVNVLKLVNAQLRKMANGVKGSVESHSGCAGAGDRIEIREGSMLGETIRKESVSFVITSPPYGVESISYLRTHLLSYRSLQTHLKHDPYQVKELTIGSEYLENFAGRKSFAFTAVSPTGKSFFERVEAAGKLESRKLNMMKFFDDMLEFGKRINKWLVAGGRMAFVIGNKRIGDSVIPSDEIIAEVFSSVGLTHEKSIRHKLKTNNSNSKVPWQDRIIDEEYIMFFTKERSHG